MSNAHITAAMNCSVFKGTARALLIILADAASPGTNKDMLPVGQCKRRLSTLMARTNIHRQQTVTDGLAELLATPAVLRWLRKGESPLYFVDLAWLKAHAFTEDELREFEYPALKASRQRQPSNLDNGNRVTSATESDGVPNGNRLTVPTVFQHIPPSGIFPPVKADERTKRLKAEKSNTNPRRQRIRVPLEDMEGELSETEIDAELTRREEEEQERHAHFVLED